MQKMATVCFDFDYMQQRTADGALATVASPCNACERHAQQRRFCTTDS